MKEGLALKKKDERVRPGGGVSCQPTRFRVLHCDLRELTAIAIMRENNREEDKNERRVNGNKLCLSFCTSKRI